ncbi:hypothetical protein Syun_007703 [Stephania yunnanensis]|uniref:Uncharacterized protein n=1 Tax=Stephania yunnanensis TaxID=152371 RepID=A0AAP0PYR8_9MAGN
MCTHESMAKVQTYRYSQMNLINQQFLFLIFIKSFRQGKKREKKKELWGDFGGGEVYKSMKL